jgi:hypothetical protein
MTSFVNFPSQFRHITTVSSTGQTADFHPPAQRRRLMMIADIIRKAETQNDIYFLLTSYLEALQFSGMPSGVSQDIADLPLRGKMDVKTRFSKLVIELDNASRRLDDQACVAIREALHIFGAALTRLRAIDNQQRPLPINIENSADLGYRT